MKLRRHKGNPILKPRGDTWESIAVFNPAVAYMDGKIHLLYRAVGEYVHYISRLGHAVFDENLNLVARSDKPCFSPEIELWEVSVEDARLTPLEGQLYMTYVITPTPCPPYAVRRRLGIPLPPQARTRISLAEVTIESGRMSFQRLGIITPYGANERDTVLFPEKIRGKYAALHRPSAWIGPGYPTDVPGIWFAYLDDIAGRMYEHRLVMKPEQPWESRKIGAGPPPLKTEEGWLLIYHGVDEDRAYRAGAALLDLEEPWRVIARTPEPILEPEEEYEKEGDVPNVVFPEGAIILGDELFIFYGAADKVCCAASVNLSRFIEYLLTRC
ncbi:MAG: glycosidase [Chloroflexi bacterium]|nr:MAG: glycosidase [Chloroflexota bacterium]